MFTPHLTTPEPLRCSCGRLFGDGQAIRCHQRDKNRNAGKKHGKRGKRHKHRGQCQSVAPAKIRIRRVVEWHREQETVSDAPTVRLALLRKWAEVRVPTADDDTPAKRRAAYERQRRHTKPGPCWVCTLEGPRITHHVIQIQNGGNSWELNMVLLCEYCHAEIHPWLKIDRKLQYLQDELAQNEQHYRELRALVAVTKLPAVISDTTTAERVERVLVQQAKKHQPRSVMKQAVDFRPRLVKRTA